MKPYAAIAALWPLALLPGGASLRKDHALAPSGFTVGRPDGKAFKGRLKIDKLLREKYSRVYWERVSE